MSESANLLAQLICSAGDDFEPEVKVVHATGEELDACADDIDQNDEEDEDRQEVVEELLEKIAKKGDGVVGQYVYLDDEAYSTECSSCEVQESHTPAWCGTAIMAASEEMIELETKRVRAFLKAEAVKEAKEALWSFAFHAPHLTDEEVLAALKERRDKA